MSSRCTMLSNLRDIKRHQRRQQVFRRLRITLLHYTKTKPMILSSIDYKEFFLYFKDRSSGHMKMFRI